MEGLQTPDGSAVPVEEIKASAEQQFAQAMAAPAGETSAPPKKAREAVQNEPKKPRGRPPKHERARSAPKPQPSPQSDADRKTAVLGLVQVGAMLPFMVGQRAKDPIPWQADSIILASNAEALADACVATAKADERFAKVIDRLANVGPYGALVTVAIGIGSQIARNHGVAIPGTADPADIVKAAADGSAPAEG